MSTKSIDVLTNIPVASVVFRDDLYPRLETSPVTVQKYAEDLGVLPPIEVNQHHELIDGWHRWTAHKKAQAESISVVITQTASDGELLELAITRNAAYGLQLSQTDKQNMARRIYRETPLAEQGEKKKTLAKILSVSLRVVQEWLSRTDRDNKEHRECEVRRLWFACNTEEAIAEAVGMPQRTVSDVLAGSADLRFPLKPGDLSDIQDENARLDELQRRNRVAAGHADDFDVPIYNIWTLGARTAGSAHFGNSEVRWVDRLMYLYTAPFDVVIDPFAGGGSTIDICRQRFRRYLVSDRAPIVEREKEIRQHDLTTGLLKPPQWSDVRLVYLDPPYWKQAEGQYSDAATDLANMPLDEFTDTLAGLVTAYGKKLSGGAHIAVIIQPTQWKAPDRQFTDHVGDLLRRVKLPVAMRYSVPYATEQYNAQMVEWAKSAKQCLVLTREIVVWRVP